MGDSELIIRINGKLDDFDEALKGVQEKTENLNDKLAQAAKVSAVAFAALTAEVGLAVKAFGESEEVSRRLALAMKNQGIYTADLEARYNGIAEELQNLTGIDDDAIKASMAHMQAMIGQKEVTQDITKAVLDLAAGKKMDLDASAELIAKGIEGQTAALRKQGIFIDEHLSKQERTAKIIEIVTQKYGGQAEAANQGVGSIRGLITAFGNLQEEIGARFAPMIETATKSLTTFVNIIKNDKAMTGFIADNIKLGLVVAGTVGSVATAVIGFNKLQAAIELSGIAMRIFGTSSRAALVTSGIGLAVVALTEAFLYFSNRAEASTDKANRAVASHADEIQKLQAAIKDLEEEQLNFAEMAGKHVNAAQVANARKLADLRKRLEDEKRLEAEFEDDKAKKALADKEAKAKDEAEGRKLAATQARNAQVKLEAERASKELVALAKEEADILAKIDDEKNAGIRDALRKRLDEVQTLKQDQQQLDFERALEYNQQVLAQNEEFQALTAEQQAAFQIQNAAILQGQIQTDQTTRMDAAKRRAEIQIAANNQYLADQLKFGTAYATMNRVLSSEEVKGAKTMFGELAQAQQSGNATLRAAGKAAALANIAIKTAEGATAAFAGAIALLGPIFGPPVGTAVAAAVIAYGAEQAGTIAGFAKGGLVTGGMPGVDSVLMMGQQKELVAPAQNFEEVIGSVRAQREAQRLMEQGESAPGPGAGFAHVVISFADGAMDFIEAKMVERRNLNISLQGA